MSKKTIIIVAILDILGLIFALIGLNEEINFFLFLYILFSCVVPWYLTTYNTSHEDFAPSLVQISVVKGSTFLLSIPIALLFFEDSPGMICFLNACFSIATIISCIVSWRKMAADETRREEIKQRVAKMSQKDREEYLLSSIYSSSDAGKMSCPKCGKSLIKYDGMKRTNNWDLTSSEKVTTQKIDKAYTLGGATTVFLKEEERVVNTYKCPYCGYTRKE